MGATSVDERKLEAFMGKAVTDMGAIVSAPLMVIGEKLGLYKAMAGAGPVSSEEHRATFEVASAKDYPGAGYDLVCVFDCLHDMGDPVGASAHVLETLDSDGTWMIVEPYANDRLVDNLNPVGRVFYGVSTVVCTPTSLHQEVGLGLAAEAGEARLRDVIMQGGFARVRRATEMPFNLVLEAPP